MTYRIRRSALGSSILLLAACQAQYPECDTFEFGDLETEPRVEDPDASFDDCGSVRAAGMMEMPVVEDQSALDCALANIADGRATRLEIAWSPDAEYSEQATLWSDDAGLTMRWRSMTNDLNLDREARLFQLDRERVNACRDLADAGARFTCLYDAFDAADIVETCATKMRYSE